MDYVYKSQPYAHQHDCFVRSRDEEYFAILMEMGCVDKDTEYLSPVGWKKISEYEGGKVAQFNLDGTADFVEPEEFVKLPCKEFFHFKNTRGIDQMLSEEHRILFSHGESSRPGGRSSWKTCVSDRVLSEEFPKERWHETTVEKYLQREPSHVRTPSSFRIKTTTSLPLSNELIRVMVMFQADGSYGTKDLTGITNKRKATVHVKKERKKERARTVLQASGLEFTEKLRTDGFTDFSFVPPVISKSYGEWWYQASYEQLLIICDEVKHWDSAISTDGNFSIRFSSSLKEDIDFIQYAFSSTGQRCSSSYATGAKDRDRSKEGSVHVVGSGRSGEWCCFPKKAKKVESVDGFKYCFKVPSSYLVFRRNGNVFCSGNTGKSKVIVDTAAYLYSKGRINCLVILAPNGVHSKWKLEDIPFSLPDHIDYKIAVWESGNKIAMQECEDLFTPGPHLRILCANIEGMSHDKLPKFMERLVFSTDALVAVDESTRIKSPSSLRTKKLLKLAPHIKYRRILAGDAVVNEPFDLFAQFMFLDPDILGHSFPAFKNEYAEIMDKDHPMVTAIMRKSGARFAPQILAKNLDGSPKYRNLDKLKQKIAPYSMRATKAECLDLPPKIYEQRYFKLESNQRRMYDELAKDARFVFEDKTIPVLHKLTVALRLQQMANGFMVDTEGDLRPLFPDPKDNPRVQAVLETLEDITGPVIIWCRFQEEIRVLQRIFGDDCVTYYGEVSKTDRQSNLDEFKAGNKRFLLGTAQSGGIGLNLTVSSTVIYFSNSFNASHRWQSEDRCHRIGQEADKVLYIDLVAENTIDEKITAALKKKKDLSDYLLNL